MSDDIRDLLPAYALGALDDDELAEVEAAIEIDPALRAELQAYMNAADQLAILAPPVTPPADMADRIMAEARTVVWWRRWGVVAASIAALLAVLLLMQTATDDEALTADQLAATIEADPATVRVALVPTAGHADVNGAFLIAPDRERGVLRVANLPPLDPAHTYQLWLIEHDEDRRSAALFGADAENVLVPLPADFGSAIKAIGVTVEPAGGSPGPTTPPIFTAPMP